jgi:hypothetical protein
MARCIKPGNRFGTGCREDGAVPSSLSDLKEIGCKMTWPVHISPLSCANMNNYWLENRENLPSTSSFFASIL